MASTAIPGSAGFPLIGESLEFVVNPLGFARKRYQRHGLIFKTHLLGKKTFVLLGAEAHHLVYGSDYRNFLWRDGYSFTLPLFGDALMLTDGGLHDSQRKLMTPAFHGKQMAGYLERMNHVIDAQLTTWSDGGQRAFYDDARQVAFTLASSLLVGVEVGDDYDAISQLWKDFTAGIVSIFRVDVPFSRYGRAMRAKRSMETLFRRLVAERRSVVTSDALGLLVQARDEDGNQFSDDQLISQIKTLIFAGYDTTTGTLAWMLAEVLQHPEVLERLRAEMGAGDPAAPVTYAEIRQMPYLDATIKETLRLHPQASFVARGVGETFEFGGYQIPAKSQIVLMPSFTHRMPEYFTEADRFDPERFLPPRDEDTAHPYAWVGFGGGPRACIGSGLAQVEIKALMIKLLRRYDLQLVPKQDFHPLYVPTSRPKSGVAITYQRRM